MFCRARHCRARLLFAPARNDRHAHRNYHLCMRAGYTGSGSTNPAATLTLTGVLALIIGFALFVLLLPVALGLALAAVALIAILWGITWIRVKWARAKRPNGVLDGRRNVRVRVPGEHRQDH